MEHRTIIQRKLSRPDQGKASQNAGQWAKCVVRAAQAALGLPLTAGRRHALRVLPDDVPALLTDMGLVAWCQTDLGIGLFIAFDQHALGASVEVQTIGRVLGRACHGRSATQTDFALSVPFINAILQDATASDLLVAGFGPKTLVKTPSDVTHFSQCGFDIISMSFRMGEGGVSGKVMLGLEIPKSIDAPDHGTQIAADCPQLSELPVQMSAELARIKITLADLAQIGVGHQIVLPVNALSDLRLRPQGGGPEYLCSLGRQMGTRAVQMILDMPDNSMANAGHDKNTPVSTMEADKMSAAQPIDDTDIEEELDKTWLEALSEYDDAADQDVIDGAA